MKKNLMKRSIKLLLLSAMFGLIQTAQADPEYPSVFNTPSQTSGTTWRAPMKLSLGAFGEPEQTGHFGLNLGGISSNTPTYSWNTDDSAFGSGASSSTYKLFDWKTSIFNYDELLGFKASDCTRTCDHNAWNCGWGPVSEDYIKAELAKCGVEYKPKPLKLVSDKTQLSLKCELGGEVEPFELSYKSLKDLIDYDCNSQRKQGEGAYCYCVLRKSGDPKNKFYTPLSANDVASLESMIQLDNYQKEVMSLENDFKTVASILSEAYHSQDEDLKKLFESDEKNQACLPGSFTQLEAFLKTPKENGESICGERGVGTLDNIFKLNVAQAECAGSSEENCLEKSIGAQKNGSMFSSINQKTAEEYAKRNNLTPEEIKAREHFNPVQYDRDCADRKERAHLQAARIQQIMKGGTGGLHVQSGGVSMEQMEQRLAQIDLSTCQGGGAHFPDLGRSYVDAIAKVIGRYRKRGNGDPSAFVAKMKTRERGIAMLNELRTKIADNNHIIAEGVLKNHAYTSGPLAKVVEMLDKVIPNEEEILKAGSEAKLSDLVRVGLKKIEFDVLGGAIKGCHEFIKKTETMCRELAKGGSEKLTPKQYNELRPESAARFAKSPQYLGSLKGISEDALARKLNQLRCAKIVGEDELKYLAIKKDAGKATGDAQQGAMEQVYARDKPDNSARTVAKGDSANPWAHPPSVRNTVFSNSDKAGIRGVAKAITATRKNTFKGPLAEAQAKLNKRNVSNNTAAFKDTNATVKNIANMTKSSLGAAATAASTGPAPSRADFASTFSGLSQQQKSIEKRKVEREKKEADDRLEVIAARLADLMESREANKAAIKEKDKQLTDEEKAIDPDYQSMLIEKLNLEREIAALGREKAEKASAKEEFEQRLADIEAAKEADEKQASSNGGGSIAKSVGTPAKKAGGSGGSTGAAKRGIASVGSGGVSSAGGGGGGSSSAGGGESYFEAAPYVITLTQDQVTAIKQNFQLLEKPERWVAGGKPPVIREGNIFYELEVRDGKIVVDALGNPVKKKALNGFNVDGLRKPASGSIADLPKEVDKEAVKRRRAARVRNLNAILDGKK